MEANSVIQISENLLDVTVPALFKFHKTKQWTAFEPHDLCEKETFRISKKDKKSWMKKKEKDQEEKAE